MALLMMVQRFIIYTVFEVNISGLINGIFVKRIFPIIPYIII